MSSEGPSLIGCWRLERATGGIDATTPTEMDFVSADEMDYSVHVGGQWFTRRMRYRLEGDFLVIRPSSASKEERQRVAFTENGSLTVSYDAAMAWFTRSARRATGEPVPWR
jgi:hypothetical protein